MVTVSITWVVIWLRSLQKASWREVTFHKQRAGGEGGRGAAEPVELFMQP